MQMTSTSTFACKTGDVRLFCFGNPLMDVTLQVDDAFLAEHRLEGDCAYVMDEGNRAVFECGRTGSAEVAGSVTNTARVVAKLTKDPKRVTYFGTIGDDSYGRSIRRQLEREGLGVELEEMRGSTGRVAVLLNNEKRTLVTDLGVSRHYHLKSLSTLQEPSLIYLSAFFLRGSYKTACQLLETNKTVAFNLGATFLSREYPSRMTHLYRNASLIFGNETEFRALAHIHNLDSSDLVELIASTNQASNSKSNVVVVTRGARPVLVVAGSDWREFDVPALRAEQVKDTNGAGDAFVGGFLARWIQGDDVGDCVRCGIEIASLVVQKKGFDLSFLQRTV